MTQTVFGAMLKAIPYVDISLETMQINTGYGVGKAICGL